MKNWHQRKEEQKKKIPKITRTIVLKRTNLRSECTIREKEMEEANSENVLSLYHAYAHVHTRWTM